MPTKTDGEEERDDGQPQPFLKPKIDQLHKLVGPNGKIAVAEEKAQKVRSDLGNLYKQVENDLHGNRKAVKLVRTLLGGTIDAAHDFMRTFLHLADRFNLMPSDDLVDLSQRHTKIVDAENDEERRITEFDGAPRTEAGSEPIPDRQTALDRARAHLQGGTKPPAPAAAENNQDLVDAADEVVQEREADEGPTPFKATDNVTSLAGRPRREDRTKRPITGTPRVPTTLQ